MGDLDSALGTVVLIGGIAYVIDKVSGKRKRLKRQPRKTSARTIKLPRKSGTVKKSSVRKAVRKAPPKR